MKYVRILTLAFVAAAAAQGQQSCTCYWSSDCCAGGICGGYGSCAANGKMDGTCGFCSASQRSKLSESSTAVSVALDFYFKAFLSAVQKGGGRPDQALAEEAEAEPLSEAGHALVENAVWVSLDAVMGWDFMYPTIVQRQGGYLGNIREVHGVGAAAGLVDAARKGLLDAIRTRDSSKMDPPLQAFWAEHADYRPLHTGRCYPHGHEQVTDEKSSIACQSDTLKRLASELIAVTDHHSSPQ